MILKKKKFKPQTDLLLKAGDEAEAQMAFYLERAFGKAKDIFVLNDLRIVHEGDVAQIDHLLVTQYGLFIVESKSVHGTVAFNEHREWMRVFSNGDKKGMPSPVKQAEEQGKVIKAFLKANNEKLLGKLLGMQKGFVYCPINVRVAISETGVIERGYVEPRVLKAEFITESIETELEKLKNATKLLSLSTFSLKEEDIGWRMKSDEAKKVAVFFAIAHRHLVEEKSIELLMCEKVSEKSIGDKSLLSAPLVVETEIISLPAIHLETLKPKEANASQFKVGDTCPKCKVGELVFKSGRYNSPFLGCSNYPNPQLKCRFQYTLPIS